MADNRPLECLSVLVVEDEYFSADELKHVLKDSGAEAVRLSGSIEDACEQVKAGGFGFALVDINIHGARAYSVAAELQRQKVPFVFVTGYDHSDVPRRFETVPVWSKPLDGKWVANEIENLLRPLSRISP